MTTMPTATVASALTLTTRTFAFSAANRPTRSEASCQKPTNWSGCFSAFLESFLIATGPRATDLTDVTTLVKCHPPPMYSARGENRGRGVSARRLARRRGDGGRRGGERMAGRAAAGGRDGQRRRSQAVGR